jgi:hypothetical protein
MNKHNSVGSEGKKSHKSRKSDDLGSKMSSIFSDYKSEEDKKRAQVF